ncbi:High-affinity Fe2+/Pb2+ permease precursor [Desulfosporosinus sp. I2]|uniref:FTR1 family iron permease n=1 Tax=Desulfosporosinus sp. I2 TaxID=1617025 RepID=UPI0005EF1E80|nr:FTR1 family protein [Desulfosporosinus sp. I2]KJR45218.1 High-affinity Fe2+/Pb2+ permease precursor [Desulfosporosinus sp. I2]
MRKKLAVVLLGLLLILGLAPAAMAAGQSFSGVVEEIDKHLQDAYTTYKQSDVAGAKNLVDEAYFGPYESGQMEKAVRLNISAKRNAEVESAFKQLKKDMVKGVPASQIKQQIEQLVSGLQADAKTLDGDLSESSTGFGAFLASFLIIVREGFEAILVIGAIIAYLVKSGYKEKVKVIYQSTAAALVASLLTAWVLTKVFSISGASREVLEGATMLLAVVVLFSVSYWLVSKSEAQRWQNYINGKVQGSLNKGSTFALWSAAFLAVYREGAETVLFYQAMMSGTTDLSMVLAGFGVGILALVLIFAIIRYGSVKLPMKPFFLGTSFLLYYLAFVFAGQGVGELQTAGVISSTSVNIPTVAWLGIYPTWETLAPQMLLLVIAVVGFVYQAKRRKVLLN